MSYIKESLSKDEAIVEVFQIHWVKNILISILFILGFFTYGISFLFGIYFYLNFKFTEYGLTNKRVIKKLGIISRSTNEMKISSIETVEIDQSILGRIFGYGTVIIKGRGVSEVQLILVQDPIKVKREIESIGHYTDISII